MTEIVYKLAFFMMLIIFFSFWFLLNLKLDYWKQFHGLDFVWINKDFKIKTGTISFKTTNTIYLYTGNIPSECSWINKKSITCLAKLKEIGGVYNWLIFFSWTNIY